MACIPSRRKRPPGGRDGGPAAGLSTDMPAPGDASQPAPALAAERDATRRPASAQPEHQGAARDAAHEAGAWGAPRMAAPRRGLSARPDGQRRVTRRPRTSASAGGLPLSMLAFGVERQRARARDAERARVLALKEREKGFDTRIKAAERPLEQYDALFDEHLRGYFSLPAVQRLFLAHGLIDADGRVVDVARNRAKLQIIEQELRDAERAEWLRVKAEVEAERQRALRRAREADMQKKMKVVRERVLQRRERRLQQRAEREAIAPRVVRTPAQQPPAARKRSAKGGDEVAQMTDEQVERRLRASLHRLALQ